MVSYIMGHPVLTVVVWHHTVVMEEVQHLSDFDYMGRKACEMPLVLHHVYKKKRQVYKQWSEIKIHPSCTDYLFHVKSHLFSIDVEGWIFCNNKSKILCIPSLLFLFTSYHAHFEPREVTGKYWLSMETKLSAHNTHTTIFKKKKFGPNILPQC